MVGECYICKRYGPCDVHHVLSGPFRAKADKLGLTIPVCRTCHSAIHATPERYRYLKAEAQEKAMRDQGWTVAEFIAEFGRNYF